MVNQVRKPRFSTYLPVALSLYILFTAMEIDSSSNGIENTGYFVFRSSSGLDYQLSL
jgi:hypothetical protein